MQTKFLRIYKKLNLQRSCINLLKSMLIRSAQTCLNCTIQIALDRAASAWGQKPPLISETAADAPGFPACAGAVCPGRAEYRKIHTFGVDLFIPLKISSLIGTENRSVEIIQAEFLDISRVAGTDRLEHNNRMQDGISRAQEDSGPGRRYSRMAMAQEKSGIPGT